MKLLLSFLVLIFALFVNATIGQSSVDSLFSLRGGIYVDAKSFSIDTAHGVKVFITKDGSKPSTYSQSYKGETITVNKPTVVRALFYKGGVPIGRSTQSYIIGREFNMAVVSIAVEHDDFFGYSRGIYVKGCCADSVTPYQGANFWKGWERAVNIEMYEPDNSLAFNQGAGARIFGGFSKGLAMKSLAILAKEKYGPKKFKYPIFPNKPMEKYNSFVLRSSGGDFNNTHFRDALLTDLTAPIDMDIQAYRPCVLFINGEYWGVHNIREKLNEHYLAENHGVNKDSVDLLKHRGDLQEGTKKEYNKLLAHLNKTSFESNEKIQELNKMMDIDNYINYNQTEIFVDNGDAGGNIRYWREQKADARWRWILFDLDLSFGIGDREAYKENTLEQMTRLSNEKWPNPAWATFIIRKLLENDSIKDVYINRFADHLNTIFSEENVLFKIDSVQNLIKDEMPYHFKKWPSTMEKWEERVEYLRVFARNRPHYMRTFLMEKFELSDTIMVNILPYETSMGTMKLNSLKIKDEFHGWYFTGCPIRLKAKPKLGYEFVGWEGLAATENEVYISLTKEISVTPIFKKTEKSSFMGKVMLNELSLKQDSLVSSEDWIEIFNASSDQLDLSGWIIGTSDAKEKYVMPLGTSIGAHSYLVICEDIDAFQSVYNLSNDLIVQKNMEFGISSKKDKLKLFDAGEQLVDSLTYKVKDDFPTLKDATNKNLERINPKLKEWQISQMVTPGFQNKGFKGISKEKRSEIDINQWWITGGLGGLLIILGSIFLFRKKKREPTIQDSQSSQDE
jgi:hypothetical protein